MSGTPQRYFKMANNANRILSLLGSGMPAFCLEELSFLQFLKCHDHTNSVRGDERAEAHLCQRQKDMAPQTPERLLGFPLGCTPGAPGRGGDKATHKLYVYIYVCIYFFSSHNIY